MDAPVSNVVEGAKTGFSPTSLDNKETTEGFLPDGATTSQPDFSPENEDLAEKPDFSAEKAIFAWGRVDTVYREKRLSRFPDLLPAMKDVFMDSDSAFGSKTRYMSRFQECRTRAWFVRDVDSGMVKILSNSCRLRFCPMCAEARTKMIAHSCRDFLEDQKYVRFLTLTLKHSDDSLGEQIKRIKKCFTRLRQRVQWRKSVTGCIWFMQAKPVRRGAEWHVHLHILLTGEYVPQKWLSEAWEKITGGSRIVDIRLVSDRGSDHGLNEVLSDVTRYAARPANLLDVDREHGLDLLRSTEKIRICGTTGICRDGISLRPPKFVKDNSKLEQLGEYETIKRLVRSGDERAWAVADGYLNHKPIGPGFSCQDVDDFIDDRFTGLSPLTSSRGPPDKGLFDVEEFSSD